MYPTLFYIPWVNLPIRSYGLMLMIGFLGGTWWAARRAFRVKADPDSVVNLGFVALIMSIIGARVFYVAHYWEQFAGRGLWSIVNVSAGGMEFYGGFLGAFLGVVVYLWIKKLSIRLYLDILAPSLMFGMSMARIGCFLNGCCWGGPAPAELPWAVHFPYGSSAQVRLWDDRHATLPAPLIFIDDIGRAGLFQPEFLDPEKDESLVHPHLLRQEQRFGMTREQLAALADSSVGRSCGIHPTQLYASMNGMLLAILLNAIYYRRKRQGLVFGLLFILYPFMRIIEETIRYDNPYDTAGLTISQFVSVLLLAFGVAWLIGIYRQPLRSPRAIPFVFPDEPPAPAKTKSRKKSGK